MGLCASQARVLMLTARKSDLEFRRMQITNAKMMIAAQTEDISLEYNSKISNYHYENSNGEGLKVSDMVNLGYDIKLGKVNGQNVDLGKIFGTGTTLSNLTEAQLYEAVQMGYITATRTYKGEDGNNVTVTPSTDTLIRERNYDKDDAQAEAINTAQLAKLKRKEEALDLEAQQIETQYSAVTTEIESVQNLVKKNTEKGFKYFS